MAGLQIIRWVNDKYFEFPFWLTATLSVFRECYRDPVTMEVPEFLAIFGVFSWMDLGFVEFI
jgi:hypothetical protein